MRKVELQMDEGREAFFPRPSRLEYIPCQAGPARDSELQASPCRLPCLPEAAIVRPPVCGDLRRWDPLGGYATHGLSASGSTVRLVGGQSTQFFVFFFAYAILPCDAMAVRSFDLRIIRPVRALIKTSSV